MLIILQQVRDSLIGCVEVVVVNWTVMDRIIPEETFSDIIHHRNTNDGKDQVLMDREDIKFRRFV